MLWICMWSKARKGGKALLDSNTRKQECVLEVELVNGVFQTIYTNPSEEVMLSSLEISRAKTSIRSTQCPQHLMSWVQESSCYVTRRDLNRELELFNQTLGCSYAGEALMRVETVDAQLIMTSLRTFPARALIGAPGNKEDCYILPPMVHLDGTDLSERAELSPLTPCQAAR